jgi:hypothetical protein
MHALAAFALSTTLLIGPLASRPVLVQNAPYCQPGESPTFGSGFAALHDQLGEAMGDPVSCEFTDPAGSGAIQQQTTTGLAFWQPASNGVFFTDGQQQWTLAADGTAQPVDLASPAPSPAPVAAPPPTPAPVAAPPTAEPTYATRNGPKTATQLHDELSRAGYGGPWDPDAMLAAYNAAGRPPASGPAPAPPPPAPPSAAPAPQPTHDFGADCQSFASTLPGRVGNKVLLLSNIVLSCTELANHDGALGLQCFENVLQKELADSIIYSGPDFASRYEDCLAKR